MLTLTMQTVHCNLSKNVEVIQYFFYSHQPTFLICNLHTSFKLDLQGYHNPLWSYISFRCRKTRPSFCSLLVSSTSACLHTVFLVQYCTHSLSTSQFFFLISWKIFVQHLQVMSDFYYKWKKKDNGQDSKNDPARLTGHEMSWQSKINWMN